MSFPTMNLANPNSSSRSRPGRAGPPYKQTPNWEFLPLKYLCRENLRTLPTDTPPHRKLTYIEIHNIDSNGQIAGTSSYQFSEVPKRCKRVVQKDDILVPTVRTYRKNIAIIEDAGEDLVCSTGFCVLTPRTEKVIPKILFYLIRDDRFIDEVNTRSTGVSYPAIQSDRLLSVKVPLPSLTYQARMLRYLDANIQKIEEINRKNRLKVKTLFEKKNALIQHCFFGPDQTPQWPKVPLKFLCHYNQRNLNEKQDPNYELHYIPISRLDHDGQLQEPPQRYPFSEAPRRSRRMVRQNDILISTVRTYLKKSAFIDLSLPNLVCSTGFCVLTPRTEKILPKALYYLTNTESFTSEITGLSYGVSYPVIQSEKLVRIKVPFPPRGVQQKIVHYLDQHLAETNTLIDKENQRIRLLEEYKHNLISKIVTGEVSI